MAGKFGKMRLPIVIGLALVVVLYCAWRLTYRTCVIFYPHQFAFADMVERVFPFSDFPIAAPDDPSPAYQTQTMAWVSEKYRPKTYSSEPVMSVPTKDGCGGTGGRVLWRMVEDLHDSSWIIWSEENPVAAEIFWMAFLDLCRYGETYEAQNLIVEASRLRKTPEKILALVHRYDVQLNNIRQ